MKSSIYLIYFGLLSFISLHCFANVEQLSPRLKIQDLKQRVYVVTHEFPWASNSLIVEMENSNLLLIDTPWTPEATQDVLAWIKKTFGKRKIVAINTHFHMDRLGGNQALIEQGIEVYGSDVTSKLLAKRGEQMRSDLLGAAKEKEQEIKTSFETIKFFPPTHLFPIEKGLKLAFGNEKVSVYYPGPAHSKDNVVVYIPSQKVLFGGCMILAQDRIGNKSDADLDLWPKSIENLQKKHFEIEWIIPGHGTSFTPQLFENTLHVLQRSL